MIVLNLPEPPSTNRLYGVSKSGHRYRKKAYAQWAKQSGWEIVEQKKQHERISGWFIVSIEVSDKSKKDAGNHEKAVGDLLVDLRITNDDRHCRSTQTIKTSAIERGRCIVTIYGSADSTYNSRS